MKTNYDKLVEDWEQKILQLDIEELLKKVPGLKDENGFLTLIHFNRKYGIKKENGKIYCLDNDEPVCNNAKLNIYTFLWYIKEYACLQDNWKPFRELRGASPFTGAFKKLILDNLAKSFSGRLPEFCLAAEKLGGQKINYGDAGYVILAFDCIPIQFILWDKDDEWEAEANILFDYSVTDYIHVESVVTLASEGCRRLWEEAGLTGEEELPAM